MAARQGRILNPLGSLRSVLSIVRELSLEEIRAAAERRPRVAVVAREVATARRIALDVFGPEAPAFVVAQPGDERWPEHADVVVAERGLRARPRSWERVVDVSGTTPVQETREALVALDDDLTLALGRHFPALREAAATRIVRVTTRANAQFALASNLPALVPVVGGVLAAGADTLVLTKNQLLMIYKLAAIHGKDLSDRVRIAREMVPVVGAGLVWRTVARELAALMPFAAGTVPKVAIAWTGTWVAGMTAHLFYTEGRRPNAERVKRIYEQALEELRQLPAIGRAIPLRGNRDGDRVVIDVAYATDASTGMP